MKTLELKCVPYGTTFQIFGDEFVPLDYMDGGVLSIRRTAWRRDAFDYLCINDLRFASINQCLANYEKKLRDAGAGESLLPITIDLQATDGTREYGYYAGLYAGLLTLRQYGQYQDILPQVEEIIWLASPWQTPGRKNRRASCSWVVYPKGNIDCTFCSNVNWVQPIVRFDSSLLVSLEHHNHIL